MKKKFFKFIKYALPLIITIYLLVAFIPRTYDVPQSQTIQGTQYWDLVTGSKIGYTLIPSKSAKKPFPIIYLHGGPGGFISNRNIKNLYKLSENGYDVYLYDQISSEQYERLKNINENYEERHKKKLEKIIF